eukprot:1737256-Rhodomonas_salina.1
MIQVIITSHWQSFHCRTRAVGAGPRGRRRSLSASLSEPEARTQATVTNTTEIQHQTTFTEFKFLPGRVPAAAAAA